MMYAGPSVDVADHTDGDQGGVTNLPSNEGGVVNLPSYEGASRSSGELTVDIASVGMPILER